MELGIKRSAPGDVTQGKLDRKKQSEEQEAFDKEAQDKKRKHAKAVANRVRLGSLDRKMGNPADGPETRIGAEKLNRMPTGERTKKLQDKLSAAGALRNNDPADELNKSVMDRLKNIKSGNPEEDKKKAAAEDQ